MYKRTRAQDGWCVRLAVYYGTEGNYERAACGRGGSRVVRGNIRVAVGNEHQPRKLGSGLVPSCLL